MTPERTYNFSPATHTTIADTLKLYPVLSGGTTLLPSSVYLLQTCTLDLLLTIVAGGKETHPQLQKSRGSALWLTLLQTNLRQDYGTLTAPPLLYNPTTPNPRLHMRLLTQAYPLPVQLSNLSLQQTYSYNLGPASHPRTYNQIPRPTYIPAYKPTTTRRHSPATLHYIPR